MKTNNTYRNLEFDFTGEQLRDTGIQLATDHADSKVKDWTKLTYGLFKDFLKEQREPFLGETFREWAEKKGAEQPPSLRAYGHILVRAARERLIEKIGYKKVDNPKCHCTPATLWKKVS